MVGVNTANVAHGTIGPNQRKVDVCSNGNLIAGNIFANGNRNYGILSYKKPSEGSFYTSGMLLNATDTDTNNHTPNFSFRIDKYDRIHLVFKENANGYLYYRIGTPNADKTVWTWSTPLKVNNDTSVNYFHPDLIVHNNPKVANGVTVHVMWSYSVTNSSVPVYMRIEVNAAGVPSIIQEQFNATSNNYGTADHMWPSLAFRNTGDGKTTVQVNGSEVPDVYMCWSAGKAGANCGIRWRKIAYDDGAWNLGPEVAVDEDRYSRIDYCGQMVFDGVRCVIAGSVIISSSLETIVHDVNVSTGAVTKRALGNTKYVNYGPAVAVGPGGDVYISGFLQSDSVWYAGYLVWRRATGVLENFVQVARQTPNSDGRVDAYMTGRSSTANGGLDLLWTAGTSSPFQSWHERISLNAKPTKPTISAPAANAVFDRAQPQTFTAVSTDAEGDQMLPTLRYRIAGSSDTWSTIIGTLGNLSIVVPRNTFLSAGYEAQMSVSDPNGSGNASDWSEVFYFAARDAVPTRSRSRVTKGGVGVLSTIASLGSVSQVASATGSLLQRIADALSPVVLSATITAGQVVLNASFGGSDFSDTNWKDMGVCPVAGIVREVTVNRSNTLSLKMVCLTIGVGPDSSNVTPLIDMAVVFYAGSYYSLPGARVGINAGERVWMRNTYGQTLGSMGLTVIGA